MDIKKKIKQLPVLTAGQVLDELYYNPKSVAYIKPLLESPDPYRSVYNDMTKSIINEFGEKDYPETAGHWILSRNRANAFVTRSARITNRQMSGLGMGQGLGIKFRMKPKIKLPKAWPSTPVTPASMAAAKEAYHKAQIPKILPGLMTRIDSKFPETPIEKAMFNGWGIPSLTSVTKAELNHIIANRTFTFSKKGDISMDSWKWILKQPPKNRRLALETRVPYPGGTHLESTIQIMFDEKMGLTPEDFKRPEVKQSAIKFATERREALHKMKKKDRKKRARAFIAPLVGFVALAFVLPAIVGGGSAAGASSAGAGSVSAGATGAGAVTTGAAGTAAVATGTSLTTKLVGTAIKTGLDAAKKAKAEKEADEARKKAEADAAAKKAAEDEKIRQIEEETARIKAETAALEEAAATAEETNQEISIIESETELTPSEESDVVNYIQGQPNIVANKVDSLMLELISSFAKKTGREPTPEEMKTMRDEITARVADSYSNAMINEQVNATKKLFTREKFTLPLIAAGIGIPTILLFILSLKRR